MVRRRTMESSRTQIFPRQIHTRYFTRAPSHPRDIADVISGQGQWKAHRQTDRPAAEIRAEISDRVRHQLLPARARNSSPQRPGAARQAARKED